MKRRPFPAPPTPVSRVASDVEQFVRIERLAIGLTPRKLTAIQLAGLRLIIRKPASVWDLGSTTVNVLRTAGYIETADGWATATPAGVKASAEDPH